MIVLKCWRNTLTRTLFIGDSHSAGYHMANLPHNPTPMFWGDANYANVYSKSNKKNTVLYAQPNACNKKYPIWLHSMFEKYSDIESVFVQSTYWNRDLLAANKNLEFADGIKSDHFMMVGTDFRPIPAHCEENEYIERWTDDKVSENYIENCIRTSPDSKHLEYKGFSLEELRTGMADTLNMPFAYVKLWHEHITHLQYREFCSNLFIIDTLCKRYGIKWHLWQINNRVVMPNDLEFYGPLENCVRADVSAEDFIKSRYKLNIEDFTLDDEHYNQNVHNIIAEDFIPYLKDLDKT